MADRTNVGALPWRVAAIIRRVQAGEKLCRTYRLKDTGEHEVLFAFEPSGRRAGPASSMAAIESGWLSAQDDGLFGADTAQTFIASGQ